MKQAQMSKRERLIAALYSKEVDRLPWAPLMDDYFISSLPLQGYQYNLLEAARYIGCDFMERHVAGPSEEAKNVQTRQVTANGFVRTYFETPIGSIYVENKATGNTSFISKHLIESIEDVRVYQYIAEHTEYTPHIKEFVEREKMIGDDGIATLSGKMSPIQDMLQFLSGIENAVYLLEDYPQEVEELFTVMHERNKRQFHALTQYPAIAIFGYEDTSTTVMSKNMFVEYSQPAIDDYADIMHGASQLYITHMCGKLTGFAAEIAKGRQDGIDSVCPPNTGDLYPWDARKIWGSSKIVIGGIDPPELSRSDKLQTLKIVSEIMKNIDDKRGYILSTGDAVPYGTPIENLVAISQLIDKLGLQSLTGIFDEEIISTLSQ